MQTFLVQTLSSLLFIRGYGFSGVFSIGVYGEGVVSRSNHHKVAVHLASKVYRYLVIAVMDYNTTN